MFTLANDECPNCCSHDVAVAKAVRAPACLDGYKATRDLHCRDCETVWTIDALSEDVIAVYIPDSEA